MMCSRCHESLRAKGRRWCLSCHAAYMRGWRKRHPLTDEQRRKDNARSYAGVYLRRGKLQQQGCEDCGGPEAEMHHSDYGQPLRVIWLCRLCHLQRHRAAA